MHMRNYFHNDYTCFLEPWLFHSLRHQPKLRIFHFWFTYSNFDGGATEEEIVEQFRGLESFPLPCLVESFGSRSGS